MLEQQQQQTGNGFHNDLLMSVDINAELHRLEHGCPVGREGAATTAQQVGDKQRTYGISFGRISAKILIDSVLALEVGAAARRIFRRAI